MASATVRISQAAHRTLRELARQSEKPMQAVLDEAIEQYRRQRFLEATNRAFAALREDKVAWEGELEERKEWDATLSDGLEDD